MLTTNWRAVVLTVLMLPPSAPGAATCDLWRCVDPAALVYLPPFCKPALTFWGRQFNAERYYDAQEGAKWTRILGPNRDHVHHLCYGLLRLEEARSERNAEKRTEMLRNAIGECDYLYEKWGTKHTSFVLNPLILVTRGEAQALLGRNSEALASYQLALQHDPRYKRAYASMAKLFQDLGDSQAAVDILTAAVEAVPDSRLLARRLEEAERELAQAQSGASVTAD